MDFALTNNTPNLLINHSVPDMELDTQEDEKRLNPYNFNNRFIKKAEIENILRRYGIFQTINNLDLYQRAFTHDSYCWYHVEKNMARDSVGIVDKPEGAIELQTNSYQRLEFLGDRVVNLIIAHYLFQRYPNQSEGFMTKIYSKIVCQKGLARLARKLNFGQFILISRHLDEKKNGREKDAYLEDCFEAFIGALFTDFEKKTNGLGYVTSVDFTIGPGFQICQKFIVNLIEDEETGIDFVELISKDGNYKQIINSYFRTFNQKGKYVIIRNEFIYVLEDGEVIFGSEVDETPNDYSYQDRIWWITLCDHEDQNKIYAQTHARDKQQCEQKCAYLALKKLNKISQENDPDFDDPELDEWVEIYKQRHLS